MKTLKNILITAALLLTAFNIHANPGAGKPDPYLDYSTASVTSGLTNSAIIPAWGAAPNGISPAPRLTFINVTGNSTFASLQFYTCTNYVKLSTNGGVGLGTFSASSNTIAGSTNGFNLDRVVVLRHSANETYERLLLKPPQNTNQIVFATAPAVTPIEGDYLYQMTAGATIPVNSTNTSNGGASLTISGGFYTGQSKIPCLVDIIAGSGTNATINALTATFR